MRYIKAFISRWPSLGAKLLFSEGRVRKIRSFLSRRVERASEALWWFGPEGRRNRGRLEALRNSYSGQRCFILGGGPSLLKSDVTRLAGEVTIASNAVFLIFDKLGYLPTFLTVEDTLVAEDRSRDLSRIKGLTKMFPRDLRGTLPPDSSTIYCKFQRYYKGETRFSQDFASTVYWGGTVSFLNLQLAYFLGCNPIYLIGFDHNYKVPEKLNGVVITSDARDENHFHPDYFGPGYRWHDPAVDRMERSYRVAKDFLNRNGVSVFNATVGGHLEVFPRVDFSSIVK